VLVRSVPSSSPLSNRGECAQVLARSFNFPPGNLRFATDEQVESVLGVRMGAVSPLAAPLAPRSADNTDMIVVIDEALRTLPLVACHPLLNNQTVLLSGADLISVVADAGRRAVRIMHFDDASPSGSLELPDGSGGGIFRRLSKRLSGEPSATAAQGSASGNGALSTTPPGRTPPLMRHANGASP
jgi:hypothetical protein